MERTGKVASVSATKNIWVSVRRGGSVRALPATTVNEAEGREARSAATRRCDVLPDFSFYFVLLLWADWAIAVIKVDRPDLL